MAAPCTKTSGTVVRMTDVKCKVPKRYREDEFYCKCCGIGLKDRSSVRSHYESVMHTENEEVTWIESVVQHLHPVSTEHLEPIDELVEGVYRTHAAAATGQLEVRKDIVTEMQMIVQSVIPEGTLRLFGSSETRFALTTSDVNIFLDFPTISGKQVLKKFLTIIHSKSEVYDCVEEDFFAFNNIPHILLRHKKSGLLCDVRVMDSQPASIATLLSTYASIDDRVVKLVAVFRYWAKLCQVDRQDNGHYPPHMFAVMVIHYLQQRQPPVLPVLHELLDINSDRQEDKQSEHFEGTFLSNIAVLHDKWVCNNHESLGSLWYGLLRYYGLEFKIAEYAVSILQLAPLTKGERQWLTYRLTKSRKLVVEDPCNKRSNLAKGASVDKVMQYLVMSIKKTLLYFSGMEYQPEVIVDEMNSPPRIVECAVGGECGGSKEDVNYHCNTVSNTVSKNADEGNCLAKQDQMVSPDVTGSSDEQCSEQGDAILRQEINEQGEDSNERDDDPCEQNKGITQNADVDQKSDDESSNGDVCDRVSLNDTADSFTAPKDNQTCEIHAANQSTELAKEICCIYSERNVQNPTELRTNLDPILDAVKVVNSLVSTDSGEANGRDYSCEQSKGITQNSNADKNTGNDSSDEDVCEKLVRVSLNDTAGGVTAPIGDQDADQNAEIDAANQSTNVVKEICLIYNERDIREELNPTELRPNLSPMIDAVKVVNSLVNTESIEANGRDDPCKHRTGVMQSSNVDKKTENESSDGDICEKLARVSLNDAADVLTVAKEEQNGEIHAANQSTNVAKEICHIYNERDIHEELNPSELRPNLSPILDTVNAVNNFVNTNSGEALVQSVICTDAICNIADSPPIVTLHTGNAAEKAQNLISSLSTNVGQAPSTSINECLSVPKVVAERPVYKFEVKNFAYQQYPVGCLSCKQLHHVVKDCPQEKPFLCPLKLTLPPRDTLYTLKQCFRSYMHSCIIDDEELKRRKQICDLILQDIIPIYPDAQLEMFGSSANGFGMKSSDLDLCIRGSEFSNANASKVLKTIAKLLRRYPNKYKKIVAITTSRVPIIKFYLSPMKAHCDISLENVLAIRNTKLLRTYAELNPKVQVLGYALKHFAKVCDMADASLGGLSSYAYILMLLHYLQRTDPPVIPVLQELQAADQDNISDRHILGGWNCYFLEVTDPKQLKQLWPYYGKNTQGIGELWLGLLQYFCEFNWQKEVVTIRQSEHLTKFDKSWLSKPMCIEDPFNLDHNLGQPVSIQMRQYILKRFQDALLYHSSTVDIWRDIDHVMDPQKLGCSSRPPLRKICNICKQLGHQDAECQLSHSPEGLDFSPARRMVDTSNPIVGLQQSRSPPKIDINKRKARDHLYEMSASVASVQGSKGSNGSDQGTLKKGRNAKREKTSLSARSMQGSGSSSQGRLKEHFYAKREKTSLSAGSMQGSEGSNGSDQGSLKEHHYVKREKTSLSAGSMQGSGGSGQGRLKEHRYAKREKTSLSAGSMQVSEGSNGSDQGSLKEHPYVKREKTSASAVEQPVRKERRDMTTCAQHLQEGDREQIVRRQRAAGTEDVIAVKSHHIPSPEHAMTAK